MLNEKQKLYRIYKKKEKDREENKEKLRCKTYEK